MRGASRGEDGEVDVGKGAYSADLDHGMTARATDASGAFPMRGRSGRMNF